MRINYWSLSPLAKWIKIRCGISNPLFLQTHEWSEWETNYKTTHPIAWWITEVLFDKIQDVVLWPSDRIHSVEYYIRNRWISKSHVLDTKLPPGSYQEIDTRILHGLFETLVDFVEVELAHMETICDSAYDIKWYQFKSLNRKRSNGRELGVKYLTWATTLTETSPGQAEDAVETLALYTWWKDVRPNRPDVYDVTGWSAHTETIESKYGSIWGKESPEDEAITKKLLEDLSKLEQQYITEDEDMMIRLIKVRQSLWT